MLYKRKSFSNTLVNLQNIVATVVVLMPVLGCYSVGLKGITLGDVVLIIAELMCLPILSKIYVNKANKLYILFIISLFIMSILSFVLQGYVYANSITRGIRIGFYVFSIIILSGVLDYQRIKKIYLLFVYLLIAYIIIQFLLYLFTGILLTNKILPLEWYSGLRPTNEELLINYNTYYYRGTGFFEEPSYAGLYMMPALCMILFDVDRNRIIKLILIAGCIIITTSVAAIMSMCVIIGVFFACKLFNGINKSDFLLVGGLLCLAIIVIAIASLSPAWSFVTYRISHMFVSNGSSSMRLFRGYGVWYTLPLIYKFLGIGIGNTDNYVSANNIYTKYDPEIMTDAANGFANAFSTVLLYGGIVTFLLVLVLLLHIFVRTKREIRYMVCFYVLMFSSAGGILDHDAVFYWILLMSGYAWYNKERIPSVFVMEGT